MSDQPVTSIGDNSSRVTAISTKFAVHTDRVQQFAVWQAALTRLAGMADGFVSIEMLPAFAGSPDWQIVERFRTSVQLAAWKGSADRAKAYAVLAPLLDPARPQIVDEPAPDFHSLSSITEVVTTLVAPGKAQAFQAWAEAMQAAQAAFPGYMGTLVQAPLSAEVPYWTTLVRFSKPAVLDAWLASPERKALLEKSDPSVSTWKSQRMTSPFAGWFGGAPDQPPPAAWKQTALVLLVLFPVVMLEIKYLSPILTGLNLAVSTFIGNAISVSLVSWPLIKIAIWSLGWWLTPGSTNRWRTEILGAITLSGLYAIELLIFTYLY
jgi:antibiotic biosynthesis monooxygenase (ABM) superfamily enzyme